MIWILFIEDKNNLVDRWLYQYSKWVRGLCRGFQSYMCVDRVGWSFGSVFGFFDIYKNKHTNIQKYHTYIK